MSQFLRMKPRAGVYWYIMQYQSTLSDRKKNALTQIIIYLFLQIIYTQESYEHV